MEAKKQIEKAIKKSKEEGNSRLTLSWKNDSESIGEFSKTNETLGKIAKGYLMLENDRIKAVVSHTNYSRPYIDAKLKKELSELGMSNGNILLKFNIPRKGSIITTKKFIGVLSPGDEVELEKTTYIHSVNEDYIDCNGRELKKSFNAIFLDEIKSRCEGTSFPPLTYARFKLRERID